MLSGQLHFPCSEYSEQANIDLFAGKVRKERRLQVVDQKSFGRDYHRPPVFLG